MGNFLGGNKTVVPEESVGSLAIPLLFKSFNTSKVIQAPKKTVRFDHVSDANEHTEEETGGVVKFRIAVTKQEKMNILNHKKGTRYSSVEELLLGMNVSSRKISNVITDGAKQSEKCKVALESIAKHG